MFELKLKPLILLLLLSSSYRLRADSYFNLGNRSRVEQGLIFVVAGSVVLGAAALVYKWFTREPSSEALYARARDAYEALCDRYGAMELLDQADTLLHCTEQDLATLAVHRDMKMIPSADVDLRSLRRERDKIQTRIRRDARKDDKVVHEMRVLLREMNQLDDKLNHLKLFWDEHARFFDLYQQVKKLLNQYGQACDDVYDPTMVKRAVMERSIQLRNEYPYLQFGTMLKSDVDALRSRMNNAQFYTVLYGKADRLLQSLSGLLGTVASLPEYKDELHLRKQHQLERARVEAMHEKARAERMKADAMVQQAVAEHEKAHAIHEQAQAERSRADAERRTAQAIEEQAFVQMMSIPVPAPPAPVHHEMDTQTTDSDQDCNVEPVKTGT